jgi:hypothetical protein
MDHEQYSDKADDSNFIPGIFNYCDRWCERCSHTARCLQYRLESDEKKEQSVRAGVDPVNSRFWEEMAEAMLKATQQVRDAAGRERASQESEPSEEKHVHSTRHKTARDHPCARSALAYTGLVNEWFESMENQDSCKYFPYAGGTGGLEDSFEIIRRYQYFLYPKIVRAIEGRMQDPGEVTDQLARDADGSAKISLISMDRSLAAWSMVFNRFPEQEDRTLKLLLHLDRLRRSVEVIFPQARTFIRPGLDE